MPEVKIVLEVGDKGTIKIKRFGDESKEAFDQMQEGPKAAQEALNSLKESWIGLKESWIGLVAKFAEIFGEVNDNGIKNL